MKIVPKYANPVLNERESTHGDFSDVAQVAQRLKEVMRISKGWHLLDDCQREALEMTASKIARILSGNPNEMDHWRDISGYNELVVARTNEAA